MEIINEFMEVTAVTLTIFGFFGALLILGISWEWICGKLGWGKPLTEC